jgi:hypothetical protein
MTVIVISKHAAFLKLFPKSARWAQKFVGSRNRT